MSHTEVPNGARTSVRLAALLALLVIVVSCGSDASDSADTTATVAEEAPTSVVAGGAESVTTEAASETTPSETAAPETAASATSNPADTVAVEPEPTTGTPSGSFPVITADASGAIAGVTLETDSDEAVETLTEAFGAGPSDDTGWFEGCPLDGMGDNERKVSWGDLTLHFSGEGGGPGGLIAWSYDHNDPATAGGPTSVQLPGGAMLGQPINQVAELVGEPAFYQDTFGIYTVGERPQILAYGEAETALATQVWSPYPLYCE